MSKHMKIFHNMMMADVLASGLPQGLFKWFKYQAAVGIDFHVMAYGDSSIINEMAKQKGLDTNLVHSFPILGPRSLSISTKALLSVFSGEWDDFDICHQHGVWSFSTLVSIIWGIRTGKPVIIQPHGSLFPETLAISPNKKRIALKTYEGYNIKKAACIVATSEDEKQAVKSLFQKKRVELIRVAADVPTIIPDDIVILVRNKYNLCKGDYWLYLGRIHQKKGLDILIEAYIDIAERIPLVIVVGLNEDPKYLDSIMKRLHAFGLTNQVRFLPAVTETEKFALMRGAKAFVLPTRSENFGTVVAEALGQQCPVICTKGAPWHTLETYQCGWWTDISIDGIAQALRLSKAQGLAEKISMGARGPILLAKELNPYEIGQQTKMLYQSCTSIQ